MGSSPAGLIGRAVLGAAIGLATMGLARPRVLTDGYQFPSLDDGVLRQDGDAAQTMKMMNVSAPRTAALGMATLGMAALHGQPDKVGSVQAVRQRTGAD